MSKIWAFATASAASLALATGAHAADAPFKGVVAFGDSLSDNGNISIANGFPQRMRFTTNPGLVTIEDVAKTFGFTLNPSLAGGTDYAWGGAGLINNTPGTPAPGTPGAVPTITAQITGYLSANSRLDPNTLYSVWGGANDVLYHATAAAAGNVAAQLIAQNTAGLPPAVAAQVAAQIDAQVAAQAGVASVETSTQAGTAVLTAASQEVNLVGQMHAAGARYVLVFNLPDIGLTPEAAAQGPAGQAGLTALASNFNSVLSGGLDTVGTGVIPVNTFALIREIAANPQAFGLTNVTTPACTTSSSLYCTPATLRDPNAPTTYLFADGIHPTTGAHAALAQVVVSEITAPQQMSVLTETPLAFIQSQGAAVGNELRLDSVAPGRGLRVFATGSFGSSRLRGDVDAPDAHSDDDVVTAGIDWQGGEGLSAGAAITGGHSRTTLQDHAGRFDTDELIGSIFGQYQWRGRAYASALIGFGTAKFNGIERAFNIAADRRIERSDANGSDVATDLTLGYWFGAPALRTGPFAALDYDYVRVERFAETSGDSTAMWFSPQSREALVGKIGWKLQGLWRAGDVIVVPTASIAYAHDGKADQQYVLAGLTTMGGQFSMPGYTPDRDWGEGEVGLNARFANGLGAFLGYEGRFSGRDHYNVGSVGLKYSF